jgi:hypothetical protein
MKRVLAFILVICLLIPAMAQSPQKLSYQAVVRNATGKLIQNTAVGMRISVIQGSPEGAVVYTETHNVSTNVNGLVSLEIGGGVSTGNLAEVNWGNGPYFIKSETDPAGGTNYTVAGVSQLLSVPYALNALSVGVNNFTGNYNELTNKPITDGSETKVTAGSNISVTGTGTSTNPYVINSPGNGGVSPVTITASQLWTVPPAVSKIKVELWGGAGGGGGAGAYSYSYNLNKGGDGGGGGYVQQEIDVVPSEQFMVVIGAGGSPGNNTWNYYPPYYGDTDGGNGGDTWFGTYYKASGGKGGKRGSYAETTVHGSAGINNIGAITGYPDPPQNGILNIFTGVPRSYLTDRVRTSRSGRGGYLSGYSVTLPTAGEGGAAVITLFE